MTLTKAENPIVSALNCGQSIWYDGLVSTSQFKQMIEKDSIRGATTNPTIFEKAVLSGIYDQEIARSSDSADEIFKKIAIVTVQNACDAFEAVYRQSQKQDGYVSIEVNPLFAFDEEKTVSEAVELHSKINRPNLMIKIPATKPGLKAIERVIAKGISVNVTLIFSVERYQEVAAAYLRGLEKAKAASKDLSAIHSVASFFVSRLDTLLEKSLPENSDLRGCVAIANSKLAYQSFLRIFSSASFEALKSLGANAQRPLWASTGTKNPKYSDVLYVETLIGKHTVNTMPPATLDAFRDHGKAVADSITTDIADAENVMQSVERAGISLTQVMQDLEDQGVKQFEDSYKKIIDAIGAKRK